MRVFPQNTSYTTSSNTPSINHFYCSVNDFKRSLVRLIHIIIILIVHNISSYPSPHIIYRIVWRITLEYCISYTSLYNIIFYTPKWWYRATHLSDVPELVDDFRHFVVLGVDGSRPIEFWIVHLRAQQRPDDVVRIPAQHKKYKIVMNYIYMT